MKAKVNLTTLAKRKLNLCRRPRESDDQLCSSVIRCCLLCQQISTFHTSVPYRRSFGFTTGQHTLNTVTWVTTCTVLTSADETLWEQCKRSTPSKFKVVLRAVCGLTPKAATLQSPQTAKHAHPFQVQYWDVRPQLCIYFYLYETGCKVGILKGFDS